MVLTRAVSLMASGRFIHVNERYRQAFKLALHGVADYDKVNERHQDADHYDDRVSDELSYVPFEYGKKTIHAIILRVL